MKRRLVFQLKCEDGKEYEREVNPAKPGIGLQPEEMISVLYPYSDGLICSEKPANIVVIINTDKEHFEEEKEKIDVVIKHKAKPIGKDELEESQKQIALLTMLGYVNKEIAGMVNKSSDAVRKSKERIYEKYGVSDHVMLGRYFLKRILGIKTGMSQNGRLEGRK